MGKESSFRYGIQLVRSGLGRSRQPTTVEQWAYCSYIRNWIRNIEQHASDNVNKILVGNKADMDESKRAVPTSNARHWQMSMESNSSRIVRILILTWSKSSFRLRTLKLWPSLLLLELTSQTRLLRHHRDRLAADHETLKLVF